MLKVVTYIRTVSVDIEILFGILQNSNVWQLLVSRSITVP